VYSSIFLPIAAIAAESDLSDPKSVLLAQERSSLT